MLILSCGNNVGVNSFRCNANTFTNKGVMLLGLRQICQRNKKHRVVLKAGMDNLLKTISMACVVCFEV